MRLSPKAIAALTTGYRFAQFEDSGFADNYNDVLPEMRRDLDTMGAGDVVLPETAAAFREDSQGYVAKVWKVLEKERARLGGDGYALTFFVLQFMLFRAVKRAAFRMDWDDERTLISAALQDLFLDTEEEEIQDLLRTETVWIQSYVIDDDNKIRVSDVVQAWARISTRIMTLWRTAEERRLSDLPPIDFGYVPTYSCFISFSFDDEAFCQKLYESLRIAGIQVWFAPSEMRAGKKIRDQVERAIGTYDKLLLVLSDSSMASNWVDHELYSARRREREENTQILFPIRLASWDKVTAWRAFDADSGRDLAREIREYYIPDFSEWEDEAKYDSALQELLDSLRRSDESAKP